MITQDNMLICIFSYNQTYELNTLLTSMQQHTQGFDTIIIDDGSDNPDTINIINRFSDVFSDTFLLDKEQKTCTRGRLHQNIQFAYDYAIKHNYKYLFMVQDDMQFVRSLDDHILNEYSSILNSCDSIIQVDPRFLRRLGEIKVHYDKHYYSFAFKDDRSSYADVGILDLEKLSALNWTFEPSERENKVKAHKLGLKRIFPYSPIFMHLPYPVIYRKGKKKNKFPSPFVRRGRVHFLNLSEEEKATLDTRDIAIIPYARDLLTPKGLGLAYLHYKKANEGRVFA